MLKESIDINSIYKNIPTNYSSFYGGDSFTSRLIILIFSLLIIYYMIKNQIPQIKADWPNKRCNPLYMPLSSFFIYPPFGLFFHS